MADYDGVPHLAIPFQVDPTTNRVDVVYQGTPEEMEQNLSVLITTEIGSLVELPGYGVPPALFTERVDRQAIMAAINAWEPRAKVYVNDYPDRIDELIRHIQIVGLAPGQQGG